MRERRMWKYSNILGVWFDRRMRRNVHQEKLREKAEKWVARIDCMSRVNGEMGVDRGRLRPCLEYTSKVW